MKQALAIALASALLIATASAGSNMSLRLVEASNSGRGSPAGLNDVSGIIRDSLGLDSCAFLASAWVRLPADNQARSLGGYEVLCSGPQHSLTITVRQGGRRLLKTNVALQDGKPLILGGFPSAGGKHIFVFLVH